jgi:hypothetical protein
MCKMAIGFVSYNLSRWKLEIIDLKPIPHAYIPTFVLALILY